MSREAEPESDHLLTVTQIDRPDVVYEFTCDGSSLSFGRSSSCDIVIPAGDQRLSALAGTIWRMDGELWVRNLSTAHELEVAVPGRPAETPLPPRLHAKDRGAARSIPVGLTYIFGPQPCSLFVRQEFLGEIAGPSGHNERGTTRRLPPIPPGLKHVAAALCEPLLSGNKIPASYAQISSRTGIASRKSVRVKVDRLLQFYARESADLQARLILRREREESRIAAGTPTLHHGVWRFGETSGPGEIPAERERPSALALPDYFELAHLLVRRGMISRADIDDLADPPAPG